MAQAEAMQVMAQIEADTTCLASLIPVTASKPPAALKTSGIAVKKLKPNTENMPMELRTIKMPATNGLRLRHGTTDYTYDRNSHAYCLKPTGACYPAQGVPGQTDQQAK